MIFFLVLGILLNVGFCKLDTYAVIVNDFNVYQ